MSLLEEGQAWTVVVADCREALARASDCSFDAVVTDPPYELGFMGKKWDASGIAYSVELWREVLRVLKPGGHLLAFGGTRTYHRMACAIEDAGFEVRDSLHWMYGTGFPKSLNVSKAIESGGGPEAIRRLQMGDEYQPSGRGRVNYDHGGGSAMNGSTGPVELSEAAKQWDGWGTALKPGHEPIVMARKPIEGTVAENVQRYGTGGLNIGGCRIATTENLNGGAYSRESTKKAEDASTFLLGTTEKEFTQPEGRWPANVLLDEDAAAELDAQSGTLKSGAFNRKESAAGGQQPAGWKTSARTAKDFGAANEGGASRFFYVSKPSGSERGLGCTGRNIHPTVKPVDLMQHLVRLVTPPGGLVLDPFTGSGATGVACRFEGFRFVGMEQSDEYADIARRRIETAHRVAPVTKSIERAADLDPRQTSIFDAMGDK